MAIYKNVASQKVSVYAYDPTTTAGSDPSKTGDAANITAQISLDGAASAATNHTNPTELEATDQKGIYVFDLTQAETNADMIVISAVSSTSNILLDPIVIYTVPGDSSALAADVVEVSGDSTAADNLESACDNYSATRGLAGTALPAAAADAAGGLAISDAGGLDLDARLDVAVSSRLAPTVASRTLDVTAGGTAGIDWGNVENPTTAVDLSATDIQLCDTVTTNTDMRGTDGANTTTPPTAAAIADQVWDEATADHTSAGTYGKAVGDGVTAWVTATGFSTHDAAAVADAVWDEAQADHTSAGSFGLIASEIATLQTSVDDVPTVAEFNARTLAAADYFDPAADTVSNVTSVVTTTNLTNLPSIPTNWLTASGIEASALDGKGDWNVGKTGYSLVATGADLVLCDGRTLPNTLEIIAAAVAGRISGAGTGTETFLGMDEATTRVVVTVDGSGNRTDIVYS
tara:strand:- start:1759 stop:3141 length:1383 start_codon:yes stop_codon:yes gene_type:complete